MKRGVCGFFLERDSLLTVQGSGQNVINYDRESEEHTMCLFTEPSWHVLLGNIPLK